MAKFVRGLIYPNATLTNSSGRGIFWRFKWMYEFWGFCINGTSDPLTPGGFATPNGIIMPTNFTGGTSLLAYGTDGSHPAVAGNLFSGDCLFTAQSSTPFNTSMVGKALVIWKPGSTSSEDSIYNITRVISPNQILININTGGIPDPTTKHPSMTARNNVCYRVVDMEIGSNAATVSSNFGSSLVFNFDAASINPGQGNTSGISQIQLTSFHDNSNNTFTNPGFASLSVSFGGSGSWAGNSFSITSATNTTPITITTSGNHGFSAGQTVVIYGVNGNWGANGTWTIDNIGSNTFTLVGSSGTGSYTSGGTVYNGFQNDGYQGYITRQISVFGFSTYGQTCVNLIGDKTFLIANIKEQFGSYNQCAIYVEVPKRLYPQGQDLHPMVVLVETLGASLYTSSTTESYGGGFLMRTHSSDTTSVRKYRTLVKAMRGDGTPDVFGQNLSDFKIGFNTINGTIPMSDAILSLPGINNQYCLSRVKLRTVKFTGTHIPAYHRLGLNGEFIQIQNGICWPWDGTIVPQQLLLFGSL
jgi:hypothetical protein